MRFLNLETLKIQKEYNFNTIVLNIEIPNTSISLKQIKEIIEGAFQNAQEVIENNKSKHIAAHFIVHLSYPDCDLDSETELFSTFVNVFLPILFNVLKEDAGRPRERRLDVPEKLKAKVRVSLGILKELINTATKYNLFNVSVYGEHLIYDMLNMDYEDDENNLVMQGGFTSIEEEEEVKGEDLCQTSLLEK